MTIDPKNLSQEQHKLTDDRVKLKEKLDMIEFRLGRLTLDTEYLATEKRKWRQLYRTTIKQLDSINMKLKLMHTYLRRHKEDRDG